MKTFRIRDLARAPSVLSLSRVPLGLLFPIVGRDPPMGIGLLLVAGLTDVADGWVARRWNQVTATGAMVDGLADKVLATAVIASLVVWHRLTGFEAALLATREILELPLLVWLALPSHGRRAPTHSSTANRSGKVTTMLQLACVSAALVESRATLGLAAAAGAIGGFAGLRYILRALEENRRAVGVVSTESA